MICPDLNFEKSYWLKGKKYICGIDEVGRGCLAGPMYVGAVIFPVGSEMIEGVRDSKKISAKKRDELSKKIKLNAVSFSVGAVTNQEIDKLGLTKATILAAERAIGGLTQVPDQLLIDAVRMEDISIDSESIVKGDEVCYSIASASIIAKVERDAFISCCGEASLYRFEKNKGYGTKEHFELIRKHGISEIHRKSFLKSIAL